MGKILAALLGLFGGGASQAPQGDVQMIDPRTVYFSMSTIADDMAPLEQVAGRPDDSDFVINEDDWRQIEFFPASRLPEIRTMMEELVRFEAANRHGQVFRHIFVRRLPPAAVVPGEDGASSLARELGAELGPAPVFFTGAATVLGRAANGFTLRLPGNVVLFGYSDAEGVMVLGGDVGTGGDHEVLSRAFMTLSRSRALIIVDWRSHMILTGVSAEGQIELWRPE